MASIILPVAADGPPPPGPTTEGLAQSLPTQFYPIVDLPVSFNTPMSLPTSSSSPTAPVSPNTDVLPQLSPSIDICNTPPLQLTCDAATRAGAGVPSVTLTTSLSRQEYATGEAVAFSLTIANVGSGSLTVNSVNNPIPTGFLPMPVGGITMDGTPCNANTSPACTVGATGMQVSSFTLNKTQQHVFGYAMVANWSARGCGQITNQVLVSTSGGAVTSSAVVTLCDGGLGFEPWWSYVSQATGPQGSVAMNANSGNLVAIQDDSTAIPGHGHLLLQPHRVFNSQYSGFGAPPNAFGTGWIINFDHWSGSPRGTMDIGGLFVPPAESVAANYPVTVIDDGGSRQVVSLQVLQAPIDATTLQYQGDTSPLSVVVPRALQLDTKHFDHICVDETSTPTAGVHLGMWRYTEVKAASSTTPCTSASTSTPVVLGWGIERPDRVRYEFAWNGAKLDAEDGNANEVAYTYTSAPKAGTSLGNLTRVAEVSSGRSFTVTTVSSTETDITDPAGRKTTYLFSSAGLLTSVGNPDGHTVTYTYGSSCAGAAGAQLCSASDPTGHATTFTYTATWSDATAVIGPPKLATLTDRTGAVTAITHVHSPDSLTADLGIERTRYMSFDAAGSVGEIDGIDMTNASSPATLHQTLDFWDTATGVTSCAQPDKGVDHNLCRIFRETGDGKATAEDTTFTYNMMGQPLVERRCIASSDSSTPPPCPASTSSSVTSRDITWGYRALYVDAYGFNPSTYTDTLQGGGSVSSPGPSGGPRWDSYALYALYDNTATLDSNGNAPGLSSSQVQGFLHTITIDNAYQFGPNRQVVGGACPSVATNTGDICSTAGPGGTGANNFNYSYDQYGQPTSEFTPNILAASAQPLTFTYYPDSALDLSGKTSAGGWLKAETDSYGNFVAYAYDSAGNRVRTWDRDTTKGLQLSSFPGTISAPPSSSYTETLYVPTSSTSTSYASPWRYVASIRDQLGDLTSYTLDSNGNQTGIRSPRGNIAGNATYDITQTFNGRDQLLSRLTPLEATMSPPKPWTYTYDSAGNQTSVTDPRAVVTVKLFDAVNRLKATKYTLAAGGYETTPSACAISLSGDAPIPAGRIMCSRSQSYDEVDNAIASADGNGQVTTFSYDGLHEELSRLVPRNDGTFTTLRTDHVYDLDGNVTIVCPPRTFTEGNATACDNKVTDGPQYQVTQAFDANDRMTTYATHVPAQCIPFVVCNETNPGAAPQTWSYQYDADGNQISVTDPNTHQRTNTYDLDDRLTSTTVPRSSSSSTVTTDVYDPAGHLLSETVGSHETGYAYDAAGRLTDRVQGWDGTSAVTSAVASADGGTNIHSQIGYDADGHVIHVFDPRAFTGSGTDARTFMLTAIYDADGRRTDQYTPRYDAGSYSDLSSSSSLQSVQCPTTTVGYPTTVGVCVEHVSYDGVGDPTEVVLPTATGSSGARKLDYTYSDDQHQLIATEPSPTGSGTATRQYDYDAEGRVVKASDELNRPVVVSYTADGLQSVVTAEPNGSISHVTQYTYDANGNETSVTSPAGLKSTYAYTTDNHEASAKDNAGDTTQYTYDPGGNVTQLLSPDGTAAATANPHGTPTKNTYTFDNLLLSSVRPVSPDGTTQLRRTTYTYADFGAKASQDSALVNSGGTVLSDAGAQGFTYYPDERLQQETGRQGEVIGHKYDAAGNEASISYGGSTLSASYYLDDLVRSVADTAPTAGAGAATNSYAYDGLGNISSEAQSLSTGGQYTSTYSYNDAERPASMTSPTAGSWSWSYDAAGEVTQENDPNGNYLAHLYNADGTLTTSHLFLASGNTMAQWNYLYDSGYRETERDYLGVTATNQSAQLTMQYTYDNAGRLSKVHRTDLHGNWNVADVTATWDPDGNRLSWGDGTTANTTTTTYNADDSVATSTANNGTSYTFSYNAAGDMTNDGCRSYSYDGFDQLLSLAGTGGPNCGRVETGSYAYDGLGRRTVATDGPYGPTDAMHFRGLTSATVSEQQVAAHPADVIYALDPSGAVLGDTFAPQGFNHTEYLSQDGYASITTATSVTGAMACDMFTDPFGSPFGGSGTNACHTGSLNDTALYRQAQRDPTSGQYQMGARIYNPSTAGFVQPDSFRVDGSNLSLQTNPLTANVYGYVNGDPVNFYDPTGHGVECTLGPDCQEMQAAQAGGEEQGSVASQVAAQHAPGYEGTPHERAYHSTKAQHRVQVARMPSDRAPARSLGLAHLQDLGQIDGNTEMPYTPGTWTGSFERFCSQPPSGVPGDEGTGCREYDVSSDSEKDLWKSLCMEGGAMPACWPAGGWSYTATAIPGGGVSYYHDGGLLGSSFTLTCIEGRGCSDSRSQIMAAVIVPPEFAGEGASGLGDLTNAEVSQIQEVVDSAGRPMNVVGSAARGTRRGIGSDLPIGKGAGTRSDIDYLVPPGSAPHFQGLEGALPSIDPGSGIIIGQPNPWIGPWVRFEPGAEPYLVPGEPQ